MNEVRKLTVLLLTDQKEFNKYAKAYPGLIFTEFQDLWIFTVDDERKAEGLRVHRVFVTDTVPRDCHILERLIKNMMTTDGADLHPIFLYTNFKRFGEQIYGIEDKKSDSVMHAQTMPDDFGRTRTRCGAEGLTTPFSKFVTCDDCKPAYPLVHMPATGMYGGRVPSICEGVDGAQTYIPLHNRWHEVSCLKCRDRFAASRGVFTRALVHKQNDRDALCKAGEPERRQHPDRVMATKMHVDWRQVTCPLCKEMRV